MLSWCVAASVVASSDAVSVVVAARKLIRKTRLGEGKGSTSEINKKNPSSPEEQAASAAAAQRVDGRLKEEKEKEKEKEKVLTAQKRYIMTVVAPNMSPAAAASVVAEVLAGSSRALRRTVQRPPVLLVVVVQLLAVVGDVYGQEVDMEGLSPRTCANPSRACTRIPCPSQGPFSMLRSLQLHPLLWMNGLLAIVYQLVDIVLYHHPLAIVLKPLAGLVATFFVAPVQYFLGYRDEFFPHYITALGLIGAALVVFENRHYVAIRSSLLPSLDTTTTTTTSASDTPNPRQETHTTTTTTNDNNNNNNCSFIRGASMRSAISFGAAVPPLSKANDSKGEEGGEDSNKDDKGRKGVPAGEKTQLLGNINSRDVETGARQEKSVGKAVAAAGVASALVPTLILSLSTAVWIIVQKYANDEYHVNAFGYTSLDQAERDKAFEGIAQKALGTGLVIAALTLLHYV
eukprot:jgi/Chlat1/3082/Chrsp21S03324